MKRRHTQAADSKRNRIMLYIRSYSVEHGYAPSVRDIGDQMEMSPSLVWHHLRVLEREGLIERSPRVARSMRLVE